MSKQRVETGGARDVLREVVLDGWSSGAVREHAPHDLEREPVVSPTRPRRSSQQPKRAAHWPRSPEGTRVGHFFRSEVDGVFSSRISEVIGLKMERDVVELTEESPDGTVIVRKLPGRWTSPEVTLTRGLTTDTSFRNWVKESQLGQADAVGRSGAVSLYDRAGVLLIRGVLPCATRPTPAFHDCNHTPGILPRYDLMWGH